MYDELPYGEKEKGAFVKGFVKVVLGLVVAHRKGMRLSRFPWGK